MAPAEPGTKEFDTLPNVDMWDAIPRHDFLRVWFPSLKVALGTIVQDSYTLLQCAQRQDNGWIGNRVDRAIAETAATAAHGAGATEAQILALLPPPTADA